MVFTCATNRLILHFNSIFQVEPNTKLFPAVFLQPTSTNLVQFELGKLKVFFNQITINRCCDS